MYKNKFFFRDISIYLLGTVAYTQFQTKMRNKIESENKHYAQVLLNYNREILVYIYKRLGSGSYSSTLQNRRFASKNTVDILCASINRQRHLKISSLETVLERTLVELKLRLSFGVLRFALESVRELQWQKGGIIV